MPIRNLTLWPLDHSISLHPEFSIEIKILDMATPQYSLLLRFMFGRKLFPIRVHKHLFRSHSDLNEWSHKLLEPISPVVSTWFVHSSHWKTIRTTSFSVNSLRKEKETQPLTTWINDSRCTVPIIHWAWLSLVKVFEWCPWGWTATVFKWFVWFPHWVPHMCLKVRTLNAAWNQIFHVSTVKGFIGFLPFDFVTAAVTFFQLGLSLIWNNMPYRNNGTIVNVGMQFGKSVRNSLCFE